MKVLRGKNCDFDSRETMLWKALYDLLKMTTPKRWPAPEFDIQSPRLQNAPIIAIRQVVIYTFLRLVPHCMPSRTDFASAAKWGYL